MLQHSPAREGHPNDPEVVSHAPGPAAPQLIAALLDFAHRALPPSAREAEQYIIRASRLLLASAPCKEEPCAGGPLPLARWQIERVEKWIEANLGNAIRIDQLAAVANLSRSHFSRAFHRTVGETPLVFVHRRRIRRAQQLMVDTRQSLAQIALECGLADQCHLTRVFRRVTGTTPAIWRRLQLHARHAATTR